MGGHKYTTNNNNSNHNDNNNNSSNINSSDLVPHPQFYHCCQLKSSFDPKTKKNPRMVAKITTLPVNTSAHAPQAITSALAKIMGRPKAETTMPVVRNKASSLQALLAESVSSTILREML